MTENPKVSHLSESLYHPQGQSKPGKWVKSKWCWLFLVPQNFLSCVHTRRQNFSKHYYHDVLHGLHLATIQTYRSYKIGTCIVTLHSPILCIWSRISWPNTELPRFMLQTSLPVIFGYSHAERVSIQYLRGHNEDHDSAAGSHTKTALQKVCPVMDWIKCVKSEGSTLKEIWDGSQYVDFTS